MYRWARQRELNSDCFKWFCVRNSVHDRHGNINRYWEYPWAFYTAGIRSGMSVLDIGTGYSAFLGYLTNEVLDLNVCAIDPAFGNVNPSHLPLVQTHCGVGEDLPYAYRHFDVVFCLSVLEHLSPIQRLGTIHEIYRVLKPGGRTVITVDYFLQWERWSHWASSRKALWLPEHNINLRELIRESGLRPMQMEGCDPIPADSRISEDWIASIEPVTSNHVMDHLNVTTIGLSLIRPYTGTDLERAEFGLVRTWVQRLESGEEIIVETLSHGSAPLSRQVWLPDCLMSHEPIPGRRFCAAFGLTPDDAGLIVTELVARGLFREITTASIPSEYWSSVGDDRSFRVKYRNS